MADRPAYVPFFEETLRALAYLDAEDVKKYLVAITEYVYEDREPSMDGPAMSVFTMGRYQLDQKLGQRRTNRRNAGRSRGSKTEENAATDERPTSEPRATDERTVSETEATDERTVSESGANRERTESDGQAKAHILQTPSSNLQDSKNPPLPLPPLGPVRVKTGDSPPFGEVPTMGQWLDRCRDYCERHGVEPDEDEFARSYGYYEDHGWCHEDGVTRYGNWHLLVATCMRRLKSDQEDARRAGGTGSSRRGHRGRASPPHQPSLAARKAVERTIHIDDFDKFLGEEA